MSDVTNCWVFRWFAQLTGVSNTTGVWALSLIVNCRTPEATFDAPKSDDHEQEQHEQDIQQEPQDSGGLNDEDPKPKTEDEGENAREETEIARTRGSLRRTWVICL